MSMVCQWSLRNTVCWQREGQMMWGFFVGFFKQGVEWLLSLWFDEDNLMAFEWQIWLSAKILPGRPWSRPLCRFSAARSICFSVSRTTSLSVTSSANSMSALTADAADPITPLRTGSIPPRNKSLLLIFPESLVLIIIYSSCVVVGCC